MVYGEMNSSFHEKVSFVSSILDKILFPSNVINIGFMALEPKIFNYIDDDSTVFEQKPLRSVASEGQLMAYQHDGFWQCMDTMRDKEKLEKMWASGNAPWKVWG